MENLLHRKVEDSAMEDLLAFANVRC
jgi:hypothetical protein